MSEPTIQITEKQLAEQIEAGFMAGAKHALEKLAPQLQAELEEKFAARSTPKQGEATTADTSQVIPLVERLRDTPNWMRESFGSWKDCVLKYDRAPFEAANEIERIREHLGCTGSDGHSDPVEVIKMIQGWEADAQARAELLEKHLRLVLEVARTWQPDYATKMDRDTLQFAEDFADNKSGQPPSVEPAQPLQQVEPGWQPIETAPVGKGVLLLWRPVDHAERPFHKEVIVGSLCYDFNTYEQDGRAYSGGMYYDIPTHILGWMPLPPTDCAPKEPKP